MVKANWDIFRAKFSENPQSNFEWLCYLLFCRQFNRLLGISRFANQSAIETNLITVGHEKVGWQAKFYDSSLSSHKNELLNAIENSKRYYPDITKLLIYTNKDWGQHKGKEPKGLVDIEKKSKELNIKLEWKCASFFESEFVAIKHEDISRHFFTQEESTITLINRQRNHTENILVQIQASIIFNNINIEIDRQEQIDQLIDSSQQILILSGPGGVGKTAVIKKAYEKIKNDVPVIIFKATEFELRSIDELFPHFSLTDFLEAYRDFKGKIIVIDSAEKLLDLKNNDPFKEFLPVLIKDGWRIVFTTRDNYLDDLNYQFFEVYDITPLNIRINNLDINELENISEKHYFQLPQDWKLQELIRNPFYLNQYLKYCIAVYGLDYKSFKKKLWDNVICKSKPKREQCFMQLAFARAKEGIFFVNNIECQTSILDDELCRDGILGHETAGYFITHDIYEEWALEKIIDVEFARRTSNQEFFKRTGKSLPIRRSFRNWLSDKLLLEDGDAKIFIEQSIIDSKIESFWRDEISVSILSSDYSSTFFDAFKDQLLYDEQAFLRKLAFILRIACKEVDDSMLRQIGVKGARTLSAKYIFTSPKGQGWGNFIKFIFANIDSIGINNINFALPVIHDWNSKNRHGETTRISSLIALQYYQWITRDGTSLQRGKAKDSLLQTILYGSSEITGELENILDDIINNEWKEHRDQYYDLSIAILTRFEGVRTAIALPSHTLKLAELFWFSTQNEQNNNYYSGVDVEQHFGLDNSASKYFPASAYRTPIYWLLGSYLKETIDFIIAFTNKAVRNYANSNFDESVRKADIYFDKQDDQSQYVSNCLWNLYRGVGSPISPHLLQSIHMALEKFFLELGDKAEPKILEGWLIYLLKDSESASISSVVASIVLAYPEKTFNVAKILFKTREFIEADMARLASEPSTRSLYSIIAIHPGANNELHYDERIKTCDHEHRKLCLEHLFLMYQFFKGEGVSESEAVKRQQVLWKILDDYYQKLPAYSSDSDKTWQLFLARMDKRKMSVSAQEVDKGIEIKLNPEIEPALRKYSDEALEQSSKMTRYNSLRLWAEYKVSGDKEYKKYEQYETNPLLALKEVKEIMATLKDIKPPDIFSYQHSEDGSFFLFNYSIPAYVCTTLIEYHTNELSTEDKLYCKNIIVNAASQSLKPNYHYQVSDGVQPAIYTLPTLLKLFPEEKGNIKLILLLNLFNESNVGSGISNGNFSTFPISAIARLWKTNFADAHSLLLGYLLLRPIYDQLSKIILRENYQIGIYSYHSDGMWSRFISDNEKHLERIVNNELSLADIGSIENYDLSTLRTAFQIIPYKSNNTEHVAIAYSIISNFAKKLTSDQITDEIDHQAKDDFLKSYVYFVLNSPTDEINNYLKPFLDNFEVCEAIADLLEQFVLAEDALNTYSNFWLIWDAFKQKIFFICSSSRYSWQTEKILKSYLFASAPWKNPAKEWHSFKDNDKYFFDEISSSIGHHPIVLYAISKLLNDIGSKYINEGIFWISTMIESRLNSDNDRLESNTIYYIENIARRYVYTNPKKIRETKSIKDRLLLILKYLIDRESVVGYMLRESII